jgi:hypothetical protein
MCSRSGHSELLKTLYRFLGQAAKIVEKCVFLEILGHHFSLSNGLNDLKWSTVYVAENFPSYRYIN